MIGRTPHEDDIAAVRQVLGREPEPADVHDIQARLGRLLNLNWPIHHVIEVVWWMDDHRHVEMATPTRYVLPGR